MNDQDLARRLQELAVCNTSHPADAVGALVGAAASILQPRFEPVQVVALLTAAFHDAVHAGAGDQPPPAPPGPAPGTG